MVKLKPGVALCELRYRFNARCPHGAESKRNVVIKGRLRQNLGRARPDESLQTDWGNSKRCVVGFSKQLDRLIRSGVIAKIVRLQFYFANLFGIAPQIDF